jgi:hypothetical protein
MLPIVVFGVSTWTWLPYVVFTVSPTVGNLHKSSDSLRLLLAKLLDVRFPANATAESIDRPIDIDIFDNIQEFSKTPNVCAN